MVLFAVFQSFSQENKQQSDDVSIYPNPVKHGVVTIRTKFNDQKDIIVYNVLGKQVLKTTLLKDKLNISQLPSGIYILKIRANNTEATRKLIVE